MGRDIGDKGDRHRRRIDIGEKHTGRNYGKRQRGDKREKDKGKESIEEETGRERQKGRHRRD
jgi:hypothetical protein